MTPRDPNVEQVELVAEALGALTEQLVFVGGCAAGLLITDPAAPAVRPTYDVDLLVVATTRADLRAIERQFEARGFRHDQSEGAPICRWVLRRIKVDLMPTDETVLSFSNRWYPLAADTATNFRLPSGKLIRLISAPAFLGTKFEAFSGRGRRDLLGSHDLEDIVSVIDGRPELADEIRAAPDQLRRYLASRCSDLLATANFVDYLPGMIRDDDPSAQRSEIVVDRLKSMAATTT